MFKLSLKVYFRFIGVILLLIVPFKMPFAQVQTLPGCDLKFKKLGLCGQIKWVVEPKKVELPTEKDRSEFILELSKRVGIPSDIQDKEIFVFISMPSMGHGSRPTFVTSVVDSKGNKIPQQYRVKDIYFTMPGHWKIRVEIREKGIHVDSAEMDISI